MLGLNNLILVEIHYDPDDPVDVVAHGIGE